MDEAGASELKSRRDEYSESSRRALIASARRHFAVHGFVGASLDAVAAEARMTKGAVYHHFGNKQALFAAVLDEVEAETCAAVLEAASRAPGAWEGGMAGLDTFLDRCLDPEYQRLCFLEGPVALGYVRWYETGERHEISLISTLVSSLQHEGLIDVPDGETLTQLLFGAVCACALAIARSDEPVRERDRMRDVLVRIIKGLAPQRSRRAPNRLSI